MNIVNVSLEFRFYKYDGQYWTKSSFDYAFWQRYLEKFDGVNIIARALEVDNNTDLTLATGPNVNFLEIPYFQGPKEYFFKRGKIRKVLKSYLNEDQSYILRLPSTIADILQPMLLKKKIEYGTELVGNPYDTFKKGAYNHPLRPLFQYRLTTSVKSQVYHAKAASYVTKTFLQSYYPNKNKNKQFHFSSITLLPEHIIDKEKKFNEVKKVLFIGSLEYLVKSPDTLIKAFSKVIKKYPHLKLTIVGDGVERENLERLSESLGASSNVIFKGFVKGGDTIREIIDEHDIYVLTSISEGLPRSMIEAMARGLPCIGSDIGGIEELLGKKDLVNPRSVEELQEKLEEYISDDSLLSSLSKTNIETSKNYLSEVLQEQRRRFYNTLME